MRPSVGRWHERPDSRQPTGRPASLNQTSAARAELQFCNATPSRIGVAIGYQDTKGWATEGWWNIPAQTCENILKTAVPSRFIYVYAVDYERGGEWTGTHNMCVGKKSFSIRDVKNCTQRGFRETGFYEIDTGDAAKWTIRLTDPDETEKKSK